MGKIKATAICLALLTGLFAAVAGAAWASGFTPGEVLTLGNEYILIGVNTTNDGTGRFALETTGGDPAKAEDDNKPLIYGRPRPWTSFTTVRLDDADYLFGGQTEKRGGQEAKYGQVTRVPQIQDGAIVTATAFGSVEVTQTLSLAKSATTGLADTMRVTYMVENRDNVPHTVGLRVMLDTMLGENDGAPFRVREDAVTSDSQYEARDLPEFWQAFDALQSPSVIAQGMLNDKSVTRPDRVVVSNWGSLADGAWNFDFAAGRDFTRAGEFDLDSALALYWDSKQLLPGESRIIATEYGLGGITIAPGQLALGVTAPSVVTADEDGNARFSIVAYVESRGEGPAREAKVALKLPAGVSLVGGQSLERDLGDLEPGRSAQVMWQVNAPGMAGQTLKFVVQSFAFRVDPNQVERTVTIASPPRLSLTMSPLPAVEVLNDRFSPEQFSASATVKNEGASEAHLVQLSAYVTPGLALAQYEKTNKFIGTLGPGESRTVSWGLEPLTGGQGHPKLTVKAQGTNVQPVSGEQETSVPALAPRIAVIGPDGSVKTGRIFRVDVYLANIDALDGIKFDLSVDSRRLSILGVSRGDLFVGAERALLPFSVGSIDNATGLVSGVSGKRGASGLANGKVLTVHLLANSPGPTPVELRNVVVYSKNQGQVISVESLQLEVLAP